MSYALQVEFAFADALDGISRFVMGSSHGGRTRYQLHPDVKSWLEISLGPSARPTQDDEHIDLQGCRWSYRILTNPNVGMDAAFSGLVVFVFDLDSDATLFKLAWGGQ